MWSKNLPTMPNYRINTPPHTHTQRIQVGRRGGHPLPHLAFFPSNCFPVALICWTTPLWKSWICPCLLTINCQYRRLSCLIPWHHWRGCIDSYLMSTYKDVDIDWGAWAELTNKCVPLRTPAWHLRTISVVLRDPDVQLLWC